jgi:hypothetical protein
MDIKDYRARIRHITVVLYTVTVILFAFIAAGIIVEILKLTA